MTRAAHQNAALSLVLGMQVESVDPGQWVSSAGEAPLPEGAGHRMLSQGCPRGTRDEPALLEITTYQRKGHALSRSPAGLIPT